MTMLSVFWLILDYACNNRCVGCYAQASEFIRQPMALDYALNIIHAMKTANVKKCLLIGGEPTLYPHLIDVIDTLSQLDIKTTLVTNGRKLNSISYLDELIGAGLNKIVISIEGSNAEIHNKITRTNSFEETKTALFNCSQRSITTCSLTTIQTMNQDDCGNMPDFLNNLGVKEISFNCAIPSIAKLDADELQDMLMPDKLARIIEDTYIIAQSRKINIDFNATIPACLFSEDILDEMLASKSISFGCQMYYGRGVAFDPKGNILPCTHFVDFPLMKNEISNDGSFNHAKDFLEMWISNDNQPSKFRHKLWRFPSSCCQNCRYWGGCIGGCPLFWKYSDPRKYISSKYQIDSVQGGDHLDD